MPETHDLEANKELVLRYMTRAQAFDTEGAFECLADDCIRMGPRPSAGLIEGHPHVANQYYEPGSMEMELEHLIAEGPIVAASFRIHAKTADGRPYENYYHNLFECRDGKITRQWEYLDTLYATRTLKNTSL